MRNTFSHLVAACTLGLLVAILSGCASSPPAKFYLLSAVTGQTVESRDVPHQGSMVVSIGPLRIPDYLDRSQIVTRSENNELKLAEFDRWAGSIENDIIRVLVEDISAQLPPDHFFVIRWTPFLDSQLPSSYRVEMSVNRFEGALDGPVTLKAQWGIFDKDKKLLFHQESVVVEQVNGNGYGAFVSAMSRAIEKLSMDVANEIKTYGGQKASLK